MTSSQTLTKELRFTRSRQAVPFALLSAISLSAFVTLLLILQTVFHTTGTIKDFPYSGWVLAMAFISFFVWGLLSHHCATKPYIILSMIGVEIFPFWKPVQNFQLIEWGKIAEIEIKEKTAIIHFSLEKKSGVVLTLTPLSYKSQKLLLEALIRVKLPQKSILCPKFQHQKQI